MKLLIWGAGFFEDQAGSASSKRATLYVCLFFLYLLIRSSTQGKPVDFNILIMVTGLIAFCIGAVTAEFFNKISKPNDPPGAK